MKLFRVLRRPQPAVLLVAASSAEEAQAMAVRLNDFLVDSVQLEDAATPAEAVATAVAEQADPMREPLSAEVVTDVVGDSLTASALWELMGDLEDPLSNRGEQRAASEVGS